MERSENITATMTRIKKSVDRSNTILLRSIGYFESPHSFVEAAPWHHSSLPASASARKRVPSRQRSFNECLARPRSWSPLAMRPGGRILIYDARDLPRRF